MMGPEAFKMIVSKPDKGPLRRILREAVRIRTGLEGEEIKIKIDQSEEEVTRSISREIKMRVHLLNSKREFHLPVMAASRVANITNNM